MNISVKRYLGPHTTYRCDSWISDPRTSYRDQYSCEHIRDWENSYLACLHINVKEETSLQILSLVCSISFTTDPCQLPFLCCWGRVSMERRNRTFLIGVRKCKVEDEAEDETLKQSCYTTKKRRYDDTYLAFSFTCTTVSNEERLQCVVCLKSLKHHLETKHPEHKDKPVELPLLNAQFTSCKVAYRVAQCKMPHTMAEEIVLPCTMDMVSAMLDDSAASKLSAIPLSNNTIGRRVYDMSKDIEEQLNDKVHGSHFSLQMNKATDSNKDCLSITYVRFIDGDDMREELLFCKQNTGRATAEELFRIIDSYLKEAGLRWEDCVGICTDGAQAMAGKHGGLQALIKHVSPDVQWMHCMIHCKALASKQLSPELNNVMTTVIATVNYIKTLPVKAHIFSALCEAMGSDHTAVLFHSKSQWLSRRKVLSRVFELRDEIHIFLKEEGSFSMNRSHTLHAKHAHIHNTEHFIAAFNCLLLFLFACFIYFNVSSFFGRLNRIRISLCSITTCFAVEYDWIHDSATPPADFSTSQEDQFIDVTSDSTLRLQFQSKTLAEFWIGMEKDYPLLGRRALAILFPFIKTGFEEICSMKQAHTSH
uniref:Uncharacterized protein n=1 Tax=Stegastes partitus TaxID=144197 RepID=A0A3B5A4G3_9TELE